MKLLFLKISFPGIKECFDSFLWFLSYPQENVNKSYEDFDNYTISPILSGKAIAELKADDEDADAIHTFEILEDPTGLFSIEGKKLLASKKLDYESMEDSVYSLKIRATDAGPPPSQVKQILFFLNFSILT